jgi:cyclic-di-GMP-binding protein
MPSFDIVSKVDPQTLDNAVNVAIKEISNRYDLKDSKTEVELNKKDSIINVTTNNDMSLKTVIDILITRMAKQGLDPKSLDMSKDAYQSGTVLKKELKVRTGIDKDGCRKIIKDIKDSKAKVTPAQMDEMVRVTGKKIDDLQEVIALLRSKDYGIPLQFTNMKN